MVVAEDAQVKGFSGHGEPSSGSRARCASSARELVQSAGPGGQVRGRGVQSDSCVGESLSGVVVTRRVLFKVGEGEGGFDGGGVGACLEGAMEFGAPHQPQGPLPRAR